MKRQPYSRRLRRHYFSLMEIMIVIVIIGMIAGLVGPALMNKLTKAKITTAKAQIEILENACKDYHLDLSEYPRSLDDLIANSGNAKWDGPYLDPPKIPVDPWGEPFHYENPGRNGAIDIYSYGSDRASGGEGRNADICSWE
ncbi:MAG: type II secretion system major pseudopilin GspG [Lentisphaeria bacterium]|nr:type II secretion system major pseudopilin GspG [Lentisphaeria bacterium]